MFQVVRSPLHPQVSFTCYCLTVWQGFWKVHVSQMKPYWGLVSSAWIGIIGGVGDQRGSRVTVPSLFSSVSPGILFESPCYGGFLPSLCLLPSTALVFCGAGRESPVVGALPLLAKGEVCRLQIYYCLEDNLSFLIKQFLIDQAFQGTTLLGILLSGISISIWDNVIRYIIIWY